MEAGRNWISQVGESETNNGKAKRRLTVLTKRANSCSSMKVLRERGIIESRANTKGDGRTHIVAVVIIDDKEGKEDGRNTLVEETRTTKNRVGQYGNGTKNPLFKLSGICSNEHHVKLVRFLEELKKKTV